MVLRLVANLRATTWAVAPLTAAVASLWIRDGTADRLLEARRQEARERQAIARARLAGRDLDAKPEAYLGIHPHRLPPEELAAITNPDWRKTHADRLRLEEAFAADPAGLTPQERMFLLQEPFYLLAPKAEERFRSSHFDLRTLLAIVGWIVLLILAGALGKAAPAAEDAAFLIAFVAGIVHNPI